MSDILLYHGSKSGIKGEILPCSRQECDFGKGFYLGTQLWQVKSLVMQCHKQAKIYHIILHTDNLNIFTFDSAEDWALYVGVKRGYIKGYEQYSRLKELVVRADSCDVISGVIADDRMYRVFTEFIEGGITSKVLCEALQLVKQGCQYACITDKACRSAEIIKSYDLDDSEIEELSERKEQDLGNISYRVDEVKRKFRREGKYIDELLEDYR